MGVWVGVCGCLILRLGLGLVFYKEWGLGLVFGNKGGWGWFFYKECYRDQKVAQKIKKCSGEREKRIMIVKSVWPKSWKVSQRSWKNLRGTDRKKSDTTRSKNYNFDLLKENQDHKNSIKIFKKVVQNQLFNRYSLQNRSKIRNFTLARALLKMPKPHLSTVTITIDTRYHRLPMLTLKTPTLIHIPSQKRTWLWI